MLRKGSCAIARAICRIKSISCLVANSFRFTIHTVSNMKTTLKRELLSAMLKFVLIRAVTGGQEDYLRAFFLSFHITEYLSQLQLSAF